MNVRYSDFSRARRLLSTHPPDSVIAQAMLGRGVVVGEGVTEEDVLVAAAAKLEASQPEKYYPFDLAGVSVLSVDGDGNLAEFGEFFKDLGIGAFAFFDAKTLKKEIRDRIDASYVLAYQHTFKGAEKLLATECPANRLWDLLVEIREGGEKPGLIPGAKPDDEAIRTLAMQILASDKGSGYGSRLMELCDVNDIPISVRTFLNKVYEAFPRPKAAPKFPPDPPVESHDDIDWLA